VIWFLIAATGIWFAGRHFGIGWVPRWILIGLLYLTFLVTQLMLAVQTPGAGYWETMQSMLTMGGLLIAVLAYAWGVRWLKSHSVSPPEPKTKGSFQATELERYARHIMLREIGGPGQKKLKNAKVLVVGAGGLGSPVLMYLAAAGVGTIGVIDDDAVEATNLQRQIAHTDGRIGMPKVFSAEEAMKALNPYVKVRPYHRRLGPEIVADLVADYDLVLDGTDNFATRYLVNAACVAAKKPLISAALTQWEGQISVFDPAHGAPCYQCVFPEAPAAGLAPSCAEAGVAGPLPGVVGAMMAVEAVKVITGAGEALAGRMMIYDALYAETRVIGLQRRADCEICREA